MHTKVTEKTKRQTSVWKMPSGQTGTTEATLNNLMGTVSKEDPVTVIEKGLPRTAFARLRHALGVPQQEMASTAMIPVRTLNRRQRLLAPESDRLFRIGHLFQRSLEVLGDAESARHWMQSPKKALSGMTPLQMARTEIGARRVEALLGQLEHGVFA
jgi:putative toxin-antitoxin system antitoxin component (TIGR02293 family)